jgi:ABC-type iron transport system FetAB ATPase subunit
MQTPNDGMPPASPPLLALQRLRSSFGGPFDLELTRGECVAIVGKSGSGKSVLLRLVADMDPGTGTVCLDGRERASWSGPDWRRQVVYQAAEPAWWAPTGGEHFSTQDAAFLAQMLPRMGLAADRMDVEIARLSTGERQRLALLRSLALEPAVLLLDEPSASLDPASTQAMEALLQERLAAGVGIILVTHSHEQAAHMAHRIFEMERGALRPATP